jgi:malic enzyme
VARWLPGTPPSLTRARFPAPRCFEIEDRLRALLDIPVFHDDQHGTAIVTLAADLDKTALA